MHYCGRGLISTPLVFVFFYTTIFRWFCC